MPAWLAAMMQLPAAKAVTVLPATVQMLGVMPVKVTELPDAPPVALTVPVPPTVTEGAEPKLMTWLAAITRRVRVELTVRPCESVTTNVAI